MPTDRREGGMNDLSLTIVIPMYDEAEIARETVARVLAAGERVGVPFEVLGVDDGSRDGTLAILEELAAADPRVRFHALPANQGLFGATQAGLREARGAMVVSLDADLQTPPELIPELFAALSAAPPQVAAVFGVTSTTTRDDPPLLLAGQAVFYVLQTALSKNPIPKGASSFFILRREVGRRIGALPVRNGNVGAAVASFGLAASSVHYEKPASYRESSRMGLRGHLEEALGSLALTGALTRLGGAGAVALGGLALLPLGWDRGPVRRGLRGALLVGAAISGAAGIAGELYVRAANAPRSS